MTNDDEPTTWAAISHYDLVTLTRWMAENSYTGEDIADAVEKPWKYGAELTRAKAGQPPAQDGEL